MKLMKDSSIEWIGLLPASWRFNRMSSMFYERSEKVSDIDFPPLSVTMKGVVPQLEHVAKSDDHSNRKLVCSGDFVINSRSDRRNSCGFSFADGSVSLINTVLVPLVSMNSRYYEYLFKTTQFADEYYRLGHGIVDDLWTTKWIDAKRIELPLPSSEEQQIIADYLDKKCAEIDKSIDAAEASIEEYKLYKKSVILQVVTNGLDHNVAMKDSGIEHLGSIPVHWSVRPVKSLMSFSKGINILKTDLCDEGEPCVTYGEAHGRLAFSFDVDRNYIRRAPLRFTVGGEKSIVYTGDFIFADTSEDIAGSGDFTFNAGKKPVFAGYHSVVARNIFPDQFDSLFLAFLFDSLPFRYQIQKRVGGVKVYSINARNIGSALAWIPPIEEQIKISRYLEQVRSNLDMAIQTKSKIIEELKAYKKSLIWETVTGKREVSCL